MLILCTDLNDLAAVESHPVKRQVSLVSEVVDDAAQPGIVLVFGFSLTDEDFFRTHRDTNGLADIDADVPKRLHCGSGLPGVDTHLAVACVRDHALERVYRADEVGDEAAVREFVNLIGLTNLQEAALFHHGDAVGQRHRLLLVVRDDNESNPKLVLNVHEFELRLLTQFLVQGRERLIQQQHLGSLDECTCQRNALLLSAGQLLRLACAEIAQLHEVEHLIDPGRNFVAGHVLLLQAVRDVLFDGHMRKDGIRLKHHVHRPLVRRLPGYVDTVDLDRPRVRRLKPGQHPEQRRLAASGSAEYREQLSPADVQVDVIDGDKVAEVLAQLPNSYESCRVFGLFAHHLTGYQVLQIPLLTRANARVRGRSRFGSADLIGYNRSQVSSSGKIAGLLRISGFINFQDERFELA